MTSSSLFSTTNHMNLKIRGDLNNLIRVELVTKRLKIFKFIDFFIFIMFKFDMLLRKKMLNSVF